MTEYVNRGSRRIAIGVVIVIIGVLLLFGNLTGGLPYVHFSWEMILIIVGLVLFINSNGRSGLIVMTIGLIFYLSHYFENIFAFWPLLLVVLGISILIRHRPGVPSGDYHRGRFGNSGEYIDNDTIDEIAIFGGGKKAITSQNFHGGKITAIFGGTELDFADCQMAEGNNIIDMLAIFGGNTLFVPRDWKVIIDVTPIFGGFTDHRRRDPNMVYSDTRVLIIKGVVIFGGGEIKNA